MTCAERDIQRIIILTRFNSVFFYSFYKYLCVPQHLTLQTSFQTFSLLYILFITPLKPLPTPYVHNNTNRDDPDRSPFVRSTAKHTSTERLGWVAEPKVCLCGDLPASSHPVRTVRSRLSGLLLCQFYHLIRLSPRQVYHLSRYPHYGQLLLQGSLISIL